MKKQFLLFVFLCMSMLRANAEGFITNYSNALVFAYSQANSVYEDENIKLEIYNEKLWATNKSSKTIFLDLSQCFVINNGASRPIYLNERKIDSKEGKKKRLSIWME